MLEFDLPLCIGSKRVTGLRLPFGLEREHFPGVIENRSDGISLGARPLRVAQRTERWRFFADANVTRNEIRLLERNIEFGVVRELKCEDFLRFLCSGGRARHSRRRVCLHRSRLFRKFDQPKKSSDAMLEVNDVIAFGQFTEINLRAITLGPVQAPAGMSGKSAE